MSVDDKKQAGRPSENMFVWFSIRIANTPLPIHKLRWRHTFCLRQATVYDLYYTGGEFAHEKSMHLMVSSAAYGRQSQSTNGVGVTVPDQVFDWRERVSQMYCKWRWEVNLLLDTKNKTTVQIEENGCARNTAEIQEGSITGKVVLTIFWDYNDPISWEFTDGSQTRMNKDTWVVL